MRRKKSFTLDQSLEESSEFETSLEDDTKEEYIEPEREVILPPPPVQVKKAEVVVKVALTAEVSDNLAEAIATTTCKKFVGKWINLRAGKKIQDSKEVIEHLRMHGLVE